MTRWIRTTAELAEMCGSLAGRSAVAFDTESDSLHHHREKVCLVQVGVEEGGWLVDPLAARDLSPLGPLLADPSMVKVLHGADYDVTTLKRDFGFQFASLFDTMIAARFLGLPEIGLQALLRTEFGLALTKDSQKDDWSRRPLTPTQEAYALADVAHLIPLYQRLSARLGELGRLEWVREECAAVAALEAARRGRDAEAWQKVKGARRLSRRHQAVLRALIGWRGSVAERTDVPAFKIVSSETLLALAERRPATPEELRAIKGVPPRLQREAGAVLAVMAEAWSLPDEALPALASAPRPVVSEATRKRIEALRAWRAAEAKRLAVDVSVVLPQRLLERVAEAAPRAPRELEAVEGLRRWRREAFGDALLRAAAQA
ncbi:MAG TPA: HRDC domain-containing protein [Vicinamibacteria bacterium]|nr:HRDC domain-containing protein [Vicinamibacteria bacterium]